jgi:hypothetical protein
MVLQNEDQQSYLVMVKPKLKEDSSVFSKAYIALDREFLLPTRIRLIAPDAKSYQDFRVSKINPNKQLPARYFEGVNPGKPWKVVRNPVPGPTEPTKGRGKAKKAATTAKARPKGAGDPPARLAVGRDDEPQ